MSGGPTGSTDELRRELAAASRMLVDAGILGYSGHLSARVGDALLIQPGDEVRATLRPERLLLVDLDGRLLEGEGKPPSETAIHTEAYRARPDVDAVAHFHHDPTTMFSMVAGRPLVPVKNHASRWAAGVPVHPDPSHIATPEQGRAVAATLGDGYAALLRGHGEVIVAESVRALFVDVLHFVENATALRQAHALGDVVALTGEECAAFEATFRREWHARKVWKYCTTVAAEAGRIPDEWARGQVVTGALRTAP